MEVSVVQIGHPVIDTQHQGLFNLISVLENAFYEGKGHEVLSASLGSLQHYVKEHFAAEEKLMSAAGYPYLEQHKRLHRELNQEVDALVDDVAQGKPVLSIEVLQLLRTWLVEHINQADADIAKYLT